MSDVTDDVIALVKRIAKWRTCIEDGFEWTDDPYIDNTLADLDVLIRQARMLVTKLEEANE